MGEPTVPEEIYREAAAAGAYLFGPPEQQVFPPSFRRAVESAYLAGWLAATTVAYGEGQRAGVLAAQRAVLIALEEDRQAWGPTKAGSGIYDMCRQVARRVTNEMAGADG